MRVAASVCILVHGGLIALATLMLLFFAVITPFALASDPGNDDPIWAPVVVYGGMALVTAVLSIVQLVGGYACLKQRSWAMALAGAVACLVSGLMCCNVIGMGLGVAATIMLSLPEVRNEFP